MSPDAGRQPRDDEPGDGPSSPETESVHAGPDTVSTDTDESESIDETDPDSAPGDSSRSPAIDHPESETSPQPSSGTESTAPSVAGDSGTDGTATSGAGDVGGPDGTATSGAGDVGGADEIVDQDSPAPQSAALVRQQRVVGALGGLIGGGAVSASLAQQFPGLPISVAIVAGVAGAGFMFWLVSKSLFPGPETGPER